MECAVCATPVPDDASYCHNCGSLVSDAEGQAAATASMDATATQKMEGLLRAAVSSDYRLDRLVGRGGMAAVYLATETVIDRKVAIKVLPPELTFGHGVERFVREAKTAATLDHPNIIPIYRVSPAGGEVFWYVMKFLEGKALDDLLKTEERFSLEHTVKILRQVAEALDYAHEHSVIHRDIKPANVMLDHRERVIVTDFGIAKPLDEGTLTASGAVVGTPFYMSPEQAMGLSLTGAADQYSTAVMAYEMLAGERPFTGNSAFDILNKHCMADPPSLADARPDLPQHVHLAVRRALSKKPEHRFPTVTDLVDALDGKRDVDVGAELDSQGRPSWRGASTEVLAPVRPKRRRWPMAVAAAVVIAGGGVGGWLALQNGMTTGPATVPPDTSIASQPVPVPPPTMGHVIVTDLPEDGSVMVDGQPWDDTEFDFAGGQSFVMRLTAPGFQPMTDTVNVAAGDTVAVEFDRRPVQTAAQPRPRPTAPPVSRDTQPTQPPTPVNTAPVGVLQINLTGGWGNIYVNDRAVDQAARYRGSFPAGITIIRVERPGYLTRDTTVTLTAGDTTVVTLAMRQGGS